eukprot:TRINITY_DN589_c0_g2_i6.p2 TRINITY_DN589_c0_g2~~TRINITY_DN589_c0_g2_i6.p2  ORF type:complete len:197 (+),score=49.64 TRINITY_DN589_c0_g2_i6:932-1522(+)
MKKRGLEDNKESLEVPSVKIPRLGGVEDDGVLRERITYVDKVPAWLTKTKEMLGRGGFSSVFKLNLSASDGDLPGEIKDYLAIHPEAEFAMKIVHLTGIPIRFIHREVEVSLTLGGNNHILKYFYACIFDSRVSEAIQGKQQCFKRGRLYLVSEYLANFTSGYHILTKIEADARALCGPSRFEIGEHLGQERRRRD